MERNLKTLIKKSREVSIIRQQNTEGNENYSSVNNDNKGLIHKNMMDESSTNQ